MSPDAYLVATGRPDAPMESAAAIPAGLQLAHQGVGVSVWVSAGAAPLKVVSIGPFTVLIGEIYRSRGSADGVAEAFDFESIESLSVAALVSRLIEDGWGRYVMIHHSPQDTAAFRDPGGALDCMTWRHAGRRYFSGGLPRDLDPLLPASISIDWSILARQLRDPAAVGGASALRNIEALAPGALWTAAAGGPGNSEQVWRPADLARRARLRAGDPARALRESVEVCVATLVQPHRRRLAEISGGLDSAIVAMVLNQNVQAPAPETLWINYAPAEAEGDERRYARAVAALHGLTLTEQPRIPLRYTEAALVQVGADFRVGLTALDPDYDADLAAEVAGFGADVLITGQGGDAVFLQMATGDALADRLRVRGEVDLAELLAHSRRWRRSLWRTLAVTIKRAAWPGPPRRPARPYLAESEDRSGSGHPWLDDLAGLPPAKAAQIWSLAASQNVFGPSQRSQVVRCLHPLLSQPIIERVLAIPAFVLTRGGQDRALARSAFSAGLPPMVRDRRTKGSMQAFYGRAVAASLDVLRPWLLDGVLSREELVRADKLDPLLDPDVLITRDLYVELLHVAAVEAWARGWSDRITAIKSRASATVRPGSRQES